MDVMPTILKMAQLTHPERYRGRQVARMRGRSITGVLSGEAKELYGPDELIGGEMGGGKWLRVGNYKAVLVPPAFGQGEWQLFDLSKDPGETDDLSRELPHILEELKAAWKQYADEVGVVEAAGSMNR